MNALALRTIALAFALAAAIAAAADAVDLAFEARIKSLESGLRCLVCQNQTLADSNAALADDLRREVRALAVAGKSDDEIKSYLVARYGDFVLYKPPLQANTALLWLLPFVLLTGGALLWWLLLRRRQSRSVAVDADVAAAQARGRRLLDGDADGPLRDDNERPPG